MKKFLSVFLVICLILSLAACSKESESTQPTEVNSEIYYKNDYIAINNYKNKVFTFYQFDVTEADLELYVNYYILVPNATYTEVREGTVAVEDYVHIFVKTTDSNGNIIEQYTTDEHGYFLYIGLGDYLPDLDDEVSGMKVGDTKKFNTVVTVGSVKTQAIVEVTVDYIRKTELPEPSDELAVKAGYKDLESFKNYYRNELAATYAEDAYKIFIESIKKDVIVEVYQYPEEMLESYLTKYKESVTYFANYYKMSVSDYLNHFSRLTYDEWLEQATAQAKKDVETELLLNAILEANGAVLDEDAYQHYLNIMATSAGYSSGAALEKELELQGVSSDLTRELTMNYGYDVLLLTSKLRLVNWATGEVIVDYIEETTPPD